MYYLFYPYDKIIKEWSGRKKNTGHIKYLKFYFDYLGRCLETKQEFQIDINYNRDDFLVVSKKRRKFSVVKKNYYWLMNYTSLFWTKSLLKNLNYIHNNLYRFNIDFTSKFHIDYFSKNNFPYWYNIHRRLIYEHFLLNFEFFINTDFFFFSIQNPIIKSKTNYLNYIQSFYVLFYKLYNTRITKINHFIKKLKYLYHIDYLFSLNFTRKRFFPNISDSKGITYIFYSLGMLAKGFQKPKNFRKKKPVFIATANILKRVLLFINITEFFFIVKNTPLYLKEIMNIFFKPSISYYKHPYKRNVFIDEKFFPIMFNFNYMFFFNNKSYSFMKRKKKGRLKRKITRKIMLKNRVLD